MEYDEYVTLLKNLRIYDNEETSMRFFQLMDPDGSGSISYSEFEDSFVNKLSDAMVSFDNIFSLKFQSYCLFFFSFHSFFNFVSVSLFC